MDCVTRTIGLARHSVFNKVFLESALDDEDCAFNTVSVADKVLC